MISNRLLQPRRLFVLAAVVCFGTFASPARSLAVSLPVFGIGTASCTPIPEICGNGIDEDCNGSDLLCSGNDKDRDGYTASQDCDDTDRYIYPSVAVSCTAGCGEGTKVCQAGGSYSSCSCTPLCEATGGGRCFYISPDTGSDSNPGTYAAPWKTFLKVVSYYDSGDRPSGWVGLSPGDVVYFMNGYHRSTYMYNGERRAFFLRNVHGTSANRIKLKAYPGHKPVLWPLEKAIGMMLLQSSYITVEGLEITGADWSGLWLEEGHHYEARNNWIHDIDGDDSSNVGGIYSLYVEELDVHHNLIHDNYDRTAADTGGHSEENSRNMVLFRGGNARIHHNVFFQTPPISENKSGGCITYKHAASDPDAVFEVDHNIFRNCKHASVGSGTRHSRIHHNLIVDSYPIQLKDFGGTTYNQDNIVEYNTMVGGIGLNYDPIDNYGSIGMLTFRKNIIIDNSSSYGNDKSLLTIHPYGSDSLYNKTVTSGNLTINNNCYYNPGATLKWSLFAAGGGYGSLGALHSLSSWQSMGYDTNSSFVNPSLDVYHAPQAGACQGYGWLAQ